MSLCFFFFSRPLLLLELCSLNTAPRGKVQLSYVASQHSLLPKLGKNIPRHRTLETTTLRTRVVFSWDLWYVACLESLEVIPCGNERLTAGLAFPAALPDRLTGYCTESGIDC